MPDELDLNDEPELDSGELNELRIFNPPSDRRDLDTWAFDDSFVSQLVKNRYRRGGTYRTAIEFYWRQKKSRRDLARELGLSFDGVKSLLALIRKSAEKLQERISSGQLGQEVLRPTGPEQVSYRNAPCVNKTQIFEFAAGDEDTAEDIGHFRQTAIENVLSLFNSSVSNRLIQLQRHYEALTRIRTPAAQAIREKLIARAIQLQSSGIKPDPFEGLPTCRGYGVWTELRTIYKPDGRGRPRKAPIVTVKRKRGRPKKTEFVTPPVTNNWENTPPEMAGHSFVPLTVDISSKREFAHV